MKEDGKQEILDRKSDKGMTELRKNNSYEYFKQRKNIKSQIQTKKSKVKIHESIIDQ